MKPEERQALIDLYKGSFEAVQLAIYQLGPRGLDKAPEGEWTPRQVVHHLADTELFRSARLRILLAEEDPRIEGFSETDFALRLQYERPTEASLALTRAATETNLELLAGLTEADWQRAGTHSELGRFSVEDWLKHAAEHANEHAAQILSYLPKRATRHG